MTEEEVKDKKWIDKIYMLHENELWLNEQAGKGQILKKFDNEFAYFTEVVAQNIRYKIIVLNEKKAENPIKIIERQGFTFVGSYDEYYIFYINERYGHIEPRLNEEMLEFIRKWFNKRLMKSFAATVFAIAAIVLSLILRRDNLFQLIVEMPAIWYALWGFLFTSAIIDSIRGYRAVIRTKKCFLDHEEYLLARTRSAKKSTLMRVFIISIGLLITSIPLIKMVYFDAEQYSLNDIQKVMPIVLLQNIEQVENRSETITGPQSTVDEDNYAEIKQTLLAPKQYKAWQNNSGNHMVIDYYEVGVAILAEPLAGELPLNEIADKKREDLNKIDFKGMDAVYTWQEGDIVNVSACKGKRVMSIFCIGDLQLEDILKEMTEVL